MVLSDDPNVSTFGVFFELLIWCHPFWVVFCTYKRTSSKFHTLILYFS